MAELQARALQYSWAVRAGLTEAGELTVSVSAAQVYDPATGATATARIAPPAATMAAIGELLAQAYAEVRAQLELAVQDAAVIARQEARRLGEMP